MTDAPNLADSLGPQFALSVALVSAAVRSDWERRRIAAG
jgi:hypothetical protein